MNFNGRWKRVWKIEDCGKYTKVDVGDSKKKQDDSYDNFTWFGVAFVGDAHAKIKQASEKDAIEILSGQITMNKSDKDGKFYNNLVVFDFKFEEGFGQAEQDDDCPY